jgi:PhoH-like ATPase
MQKIFVLDTNVLLHDPGALTAFADNIVCVPIHVIEEIDSFKKELSELGQNARQVSRNLDALRKKGDLLKGVPNGLGGLVQVLFTGYEHLEDLSPLHKDLPLSHLMDTLIIKAALELSEAKKDVPLIFVTKDVNLRIRAEAMGLKTADYNREMKDVSELYPGTGELFLDDELVRQLGSTGSIPLPEGVEIFENQYLVVKGRENGSLSILARGRKKVGELQRIVDLKTPVWGIRPRNKEQHFALDALLRDDIKLVTLIGKAGTGKTLLAIAAGLQKVADEGIFVRLLVSRPIFPLGRDIGFLPGDVEQKLNPWMKPIHDNLEFLMGLSKTDRRFARNYQDMLDKDYIEVEPLTYIRGRSIQNQYMIVDEAQNLTPHEVKTILTRVGEGTKIILTGDPHQIDHPYIDSVNNGLVYCAERFKSSPITATVTLTKGERSELAELAANLL